MAAVRAAQDLLHVLLRGPRSPSQGNVWGSSPGFPPSGATRSQGQRVMFTWAASLPHIHVQ